MPQSDGKIIIDTGINSDGFDKDSQELFKKLSASARKLSSDIKINTQFISAYQDKINELNDSFDKLSSNAKIKAVHQIDIYSKSIVDLTNKLDDLKIKQKAVNDLLSTIPKQQMISQKSSSSDINTDKSNPFINFFKTIPKIKKSSIDLGRSIKQQFMGISSIFENINGLSNQLFRIAKYQILRQFIRSIIKESKLAFTDLATYSQPLNKSVQSMVDSFKHLANSIVSVLAPVIQALSPIITNITNIITSFLNRLSMLSSAIFGNSKTAIIADTSFSGYSKALNKTANSSKKASKASKDMQKSLAKFDKLDVFKKDKQNGIGSMADEIPKAMEMFNKVQIPNEILSFAEKLKKTFEPLHDVIAYTGKSFTDNFFVPVSEHVKNTVIPRFFEDLRENISSTNFTPLKNSIDALFKALTPFTKNIFDGLEWGFKNIFLPLAKWNSENLLPAFLRVLASSINLVNKAIEVGKPIFEVWWEHLKLIGKWTGKAIINALNTISYWLDKLSEWIETHPEEFRAFMDEVGTFAAALFAAKGIIDGLTKISALITTIKVIIPAVIKGLGMINWWVLAIVAAIGSLIKMFKNAEQHTMAYTNELNRVKNMNEQDRNEYARISREAERTVEAVKKIEASGKSFPVAGYYNPKFKINPKYGFKSYIPHLATGTVVSPNERFLAMLGDNTSEKEIVSPLSTMKQALSEALYENGGLGRNNDIVLQIDGSTFARLINPYSQAENSRLGLSMVSEV